MPHLAVMLLEALLVAASKARMTFTPDERRLFGAALVALERRRYAAEDAAVCARIEDLQEPQGLTSAVP